MAQKLHYEKQGTNRIAGLISVIQITVILLKHCSYIRWHIPPKISCSCYKIEHGQS